MVEFSYLNKQDYSLNVRYEYIEMIIYSAFAFFLPFVIGHPQIVVGIGVNIALVMAALNVRVYRLLPVVIFPSLGVLTKGLIFGSFTWFLVYMIPFIWVGNFVLVYFIKTVFLSKKHNKWIALGIGAFVKFALLFASAFLLVSLSIIPAPFLIAMGPMQLLTAVIGGVIAYGIHEVKKKLLVSG